MLKTVHVRLNPYNSDYSSVSGCKTLLRPVLDGIFVPNVTPFTREGDLDVEALRACVRFWVENGVSGLMPCGSNGEAPYLSREERGKVIDVVVDEANGRIPIIAGTGSLSTRETVNLTMDAKNLGVDAALIVAPFYYKLTNREVIVHYRAVLESVDIPIVLYNVPKFTGFSLDPVVIHQLTRENEQVIAVKDSSGKIDTVREIIRLVGSSVSVLAGAADITLSSFSLGSRGAVLAVANVFPATCKRLYEAFRNNRLDEAKRLQERITLANDLLVKRNNQLSAIKEALNTIGLSAGYPRRPALTLEDREKTAVQAFVKTMSDAHL
jgi:4-hydroxy-tetrahydrodipicolinate synthase